MVENEIQERLRSCLNHQIQELELLQSMYPNPGEIRLDNKLLTKIRVHVESNSEYFPPHLDYSLNITIGVLKLEVCVDLPNMYPNEVPDILVRCDQLNRKQQTELNSNLEFFLRTLERDQPCIYSIILWLQDNAEEYTASINKSNIQSDSTSDDIVTDTFARYWVYSHHIYNKRKRDEILQNARDLDLTGFCLSGKPGIICIEGKESDCKQWWKIIKSMTWKRITIRKIETSTVNCILKERKFKKFEEIHMDMSTFCKFLEEHGIYSFNDFFGFTD